MRTKIIVAYDENRCIGKGDKIPWHIKEDFIHFKETTLNSTIIMGRKTWESLPKKPLPKRKNVVISRNLHYCVPKDVELFNDLSPALEKYPDSFLIGGANIYKQGIELGINCIIASEIEGTHDGDVYFPKLGSEWSSRILKELKGFRIVEWSTCL